MELYSKRAHEICIFTQNFLYFRPILTETVSVD